MPPTGINEEQEAHLALIMNILSLVSFILMIPVLLTFTCYRERRQTTGNILTFSFCVGVFGISLVRSMPLFVQPGGWSSHTTLLEDYTLCRIQAMGYHFFSLLTTFVWLVLAWALHRSVVEARPVSLGLCVRLVAVFAMVAATLTAVGWAIESYGPLTFFCWFAPHHPAKQMLLFQTWFLAAMTVGSVMWLRVLHAFRMVSKTAAKYRRVFGGQERSKRLPHYTRHLCFLLLYFFVSFVVTGNYAMFQLLGRETYWMWLIDIICVSSIGLFVFVSVGLTSSHCTLYSRTVRGRLGYDVSTPPSDSSAINPLMSPSSRPTSLPPVYGTQAVNGR